MLYAVNVAVLDLTILVLMPTYLKDYSVRRILEQNKLSIIGSEQEKKTTKIIQEKISTILKKGRQFKVDQTLKYKN